MLWIFLEGHGSGSVVLPRGWGKKEGGGGGGGGAAISKCKWPSRTVAFEASFVELFLGFC